MIGRSWRGWTDRDDADVYQSLLQEEIGPGVRGRAGCEGLLVLRRVSDEAAHHRLLSRLPERP